MMMQCSVLLAEGIRDPYITALILKLLSPIYSSLLLHKWLGYIKFCFYIPKFQTWVDLKYSYTDQNYLNKESL